MEIEVHSVCSLMGSVTGKGWQPVLRWMGGKFCKDIPSAERGRGSAPAVLEAARPVNREVSGGSVVSTPQCWS